MESFCPTGREFQVAKSSGKVSPPVPTSAIDLAKEEEEEDAGDEDEAPPKMEIDLDVIQWLQQKCEEVRRGQNQTSCSEIFHRFSAMARSASDIFRQVQVRAGSSDSRLCCSGVDRGMSKSGILALQCHSS